MKAIDNRYERGREDDVDDLEVLLEATLEKLEAILTEAAEDLDLHEDLEPDVDDEPDPGEGCSIEEQFVEGYARHLTSPEHFPRENLESYLEDVLVSAQRGGMTPAGYRAARGEHLVALAAELQREQREDISRRLRRLGGPLARRHVGRLGAGRGDSDRPW